MSSTHVLFTWVLNFSKVKYVNFLFLVRIPTFMPMFFFYNDEFTLPEPMSTLQAYGSRSVHIKKSMCGQSHQRKHAQEDSNF